MEEEQDEMMGRLEAATALLERVLDRIEGSSSTGEVEKISATVDQSRREVELVEKLASEERNNPVLELWPSQRTALRSSLLDPARRGAAG